MTLEELKAFLKSFFPEPPEPGAVLDERAVKTVEVMPFVKVTVKTSMLTEENRNKFIQVVAKVPRIHKGVSWTAFTQHPEYGEHITKSVAQIIIGIGKLFDLWELIPMDIENQMVRDDYIKRDSGIEALPSITGICQAGAKGTWRS